MRVSELLAGRPTINLPARMSVGASLMLRLLLVLALFGIAVGGHWWARDGLRDVVDGQVSFADVVYFTTITITTVGYGDIIPVSDFARMFDTLVITPIRLGVWFIFLGTAYSFLLERGWQQWRTYMTQRTLNGHLILCGFGTSGAAAIEELIGEGVDPATIVVIDRDRQRVDAANHSGALGIQGDATQDSVLETACASRASRIIVSQSRDEVAALIVLSARRQAPNATISVLVKSEENADLLRHAGADAIINPVLLGGRLLARAANHRHAVDYITDLATARGRVSLCERPVKDDEVGQPLAALKTGLGVRIIRAGKPVGWFDPGAARLEPGDLIVEILRQV